MSQLLTLMIRNKCGEKMLEVYEPFNGSTSPNKKKCAHQWGGGGGGGAQTTDLCVANWQGSWANMHLLKAS